jgi:hypothetical protein
VRVAGAGHDGADLVDGVPDGRHPEGLTLDVAATERVRGARTD